MARRLLVATAVIAFAGVACSGSIGLLPTPAARPMTVEQIDVAQPASAETRLTITFGAGQLRVSPGAASLVEGTAAYNVEQLKPEVIVNGGSVEIRQRQILKLLEPAEVSSVWDLRLGPAPMDLTINAGAYEGHLELGGLALTGLTVKDGASSVRLSFDKPNPESMQVFRYETGASEVELVGLANANVRTMLVTAGAGNHTLDFGGQLRQDATVTISAGLSNLVLSIPRKIPATVTTETALSNVSVDPSWSADDNRYTQTGTGPGLTIIIRGGLGNLAITD